MKETIKDWKEEISAMFGGDDNLQDNHKAVPVPERLKKHKKVAIITGDDVEDIELFYPYYRFHEEGYDVDVITIKGGEVKGKHGLGLKESKSILDVHSKDYDLLYLPGGKAPEKLRDNERVLNFVREFTNSGKLIAAVCHGPQILVSAGVIKGKKIAAWPAVKEEIEKAGGIYANEALKEDGQFITARKPGDLHRHLYGVFDCLNSNKEKKTS